MVAAINEVGHTLGIDTIAEHAHDAATVGSLRQMGVDYAQGYAFGAPAPLEQRSVLRRGVPRQDMGRAPAPRPGSEASGISEGARLC